MKNAAKTMKKNRAVRYPETVRRRIPAREFLCFYYTRIGSGLQSEFDLISDNSGPAAPCNLRKESEGTRSKTRSSLPEIP